MSEVILTIKNSTIDQKIDLLYSFGSNLTISVKKLTATNKKSIEAFKKYLLLTRTKNKAFEPENNKVDKDKTEVFGSVCRILWLPLYDKIRTYFAEDPDAE